MGEGAFGWEIGEAVGRGASATVYRVTRGGVAVALKVARDADADAILAREATLLARAARRFGPALVEAGRVPEGARGLRVGAVYVATSWTEGAPLDPTIVPTGEREALALRVAYGVGRGLAELHEAHVRHGDVKPANVIVSPEAATLIDLGLARAHAEALAGGTPRYVPPEIRTGEAASPAADLWALGIVLAEILAPEVAGADDPVALAARAFGRGEVGALVEALVASTPGARPSAAWIASRAARALGLDGDPPAERTCAREARVRRAYLAARSDVGAGPIAPGVGGAPRRWLSEIGAVLARVSPPAHVGAPGVAPLDALGVMRWVVGLVGPAAAAWPLPVGSEGDLADRMLALCNEAAPEAWTASDLAGGTRPRAAAAFPAARDERALALVRALARPAPPEAAIAAAEDDVLDGGAPAALAIELARALLRRGDVGRAFAALAAAPDDVPEAALLRAEIARRRGDAATAEALARRAAVDAAQADDACALLARLAWDAGAVDRAEEELGDAAGARAAEVRGLVAYARGQHEAGVRVVEAALRGDHDGLGLARLEGTRGVLEHARGRATASLAAFARASDLASREGALVEEATYLTGLAAAAVDEGATARALPAATRAALLWERLGTPALASRALLSRAAAFAMIGARHEADVAAEDASRRARASGDRRAAAFARWARVETRPPGDPVARDEALAADAELAGASDEDRVRASARLLVWADGRRADGARVDLDAIDERVAQRSAAARWEWWGARALARTAPPSRVLGAIVALLDVPAPLASRGPALAAGARLAAELGDGDVARRLEAAREAAAEALERGAPEEHRAALASVAWARRAKDAGASALGAQQVEQLDAIVRALSSRDRLKPLLEQVVDTMVLWTGVERGLLLLRAPDGGLAPRAARNLARRDLSGEQLALSMTLARRAMEERQAVLATDAFAQVGDLHASVHALRLRSVLAVPLVARGDVLGVVYLDDRVRRGAFGPSELAWVRLVASQAALAIADARDQALLRRAVRRAERANAKLAAELGAREAELASARAELAQGEGTRYRYDEIAGRSEPMRAMLRLVDRVTASEVPVLLVGESGTGKELVARAIHANGPRASRAFVGENCASVPETLLESTLFGHVRGAFTGASGTRAGLFDVADGGTLFLDEIGEMPLSMQTKLLRVLQNGEVRPVGGDKTHRADVRIIGATHRDLEAMVAAGGFREDLFYRLDVVTIRVPPLRERAQDIPLLVARLLEKHQGDRKIKVTRAAMDRLVAFPWPGNVRQLENELRRAIVLADDRIDVAELSDEVARGGPGAAREAGLGLKARVDALEAQLVRDALARTKGNQTRAAEVLGVSRFGLQKMMRRLKIEGSKA